MRWSSCTRVHLSDGTWAFNKCFVHWLVTQSHGQDKNSTVMTVVKIHTHPHNRGRDCGSSYRLTLIDVTVAIGPHSDLPRRRRKDENRWWCCVAVRVNLRRVPRYKPILPPPPLPRLPQFIENVVSFNFADARYLNPADNLFSSLHRRFISSPYLHVTALLAIILDSIFACARIRASCASRFRLIYWQRRPSRRRDICESNVWGSLTRNSDATLNL